MAISVMLFNGSPPKGGNTETCLRRVQRGLESAGIRSAIVSIAVLAVLPIAPVFGQDQGVKLSIEPMVLPTYEVAPPDLNPRFYAGRVYQGARASFYPYPVQDRLTDRRTTKTYTAAVIENRYIRVAILPEIGGRIFVARDKTNGYDFFYRQHVIKPALIGMLGAWISGGVEWNVPHHHRATSFLPVGWTTEIVESPQEMGVAARSGSLPGLPAGDNGSAAGPGAGTADPAMVVPGAEASEAFPPSHRIRKATVWVGETEWRHRMRWLVGISLHDDRSWIEMDVRIFNRTSVAHSFLFWINPAVHASEQYQVIFPPGTEFAVQHAKPEFARWPIADGRYAGVDYAGVDISWWKNHPEPVSFFAWNSQEDFFGGYDHGRRAGVLHVANHHMVPGKKFFEWGNGPQGEMWTRILTETDGPYLELMAGAYSDNQPDYSWIQPSEVKTFRHQWYPIRDLGGAKNATEDAAVNLEVTGARARVAFNATAEYRNARVALEGPAGMILDREVTVSPELPFAAEVDLVPGTRQEDLRVSLRSAEGRELVSYRPVPRGDPKPFPPPVERPRPPRDIERSEDLYLTGLRVEQLHSPAADPEPYYEEAIRRDPGDYRSNVALGLLHLKHGRLAEAEARLRVAAERATENYIRPKDGEAFYYLGVTLRGLGRAADARDAFWRSVWSAAWKAAGHEALAELDCEEGRYEEALLHVDRSLASSGDSPRALCLRSALLRRLGRHAEAAVSAGEAMALDPLDLRASYESLLSAREELHGAGALGIPIRGPTDPGQEGRSILDRVFDAAEGQARRAFLSALRDIIETRFREETLRSTAVDPEAFVEAAVECADAGLHDDAVSILRLWLDLAPEGARKSPMLHYHLAYYLRKLGREAEAAEQLEAAASLPTDYCFPFRFESAEVLEDAMRSNPRDARAPYYLGALLYDHQPERAIAAWESSAALDPDFHLVHRNLGLAYAQVRRDPAQAITSMERAVTLQPLDARLYYELDTLYEAGNAPLEKRLESLDRQPRIVAQRDDAFTRRILVCIRLGRLDEAISMLEGRQFHNWEGRGEIHGIRADAHIERGNRRLRSGDAPGALADFEAALAYPENLEVGRPLRDRRAAEVHQRIGEARKALKDDAGARTAFEKVVALESGTAPESRYAVGLAYRELGREDDARKVFQGLVDGARKDLEAASSVDYFDKFGERTSEASRRARASYLLGLGLRGLGKEEEATLEFRKALELDVGHLGARSQLEGR